MINKEVMIAYVDATNQTFSRNDMNQAWVLLDTDSDGNISKEEFQAAVEQYEAPQSLKRTGASQQTDILFHLYDKNNDGYLSLSEVKKLINMAFGSAFSDKQKSQYAHWIIKSIDINHDDMLAWYEVYTALK